MQLGMVGLGRMGANVVRRLIESGGDELTPDRCVVVGDTPHDADAAHAAGLSAPGYAPERIPCVGVASHNFNADQLRDGGAEWVIDSLNDGLPEEALT